MSRSRITNAVNRFINVSEVKHHENSKPFEDRSKNAVAHHHTGALFRAVAARYRHGKETGSEFRRV